MALKRSLQEHKEGQEAVDKYLATLPPPKPPAAADAAPETEPVG